MQRWLKMFGNEEKERILLQVVNANGSKEEVMN
jgi:hypothetical protein